MVKLPKLFEKIFCLLFLDICLQVVKDNCNPIFDETFEYAINQDEVDHKQLEVTVCTQKQLFQASSNVMGKVILATNNRNEFQLIYLFI